jgi:hypothetical protein
MSQTQLVYILLYLQRVARSDYVFRPSLLGHHQVVGFNQGDYTIWDIKSLIFNEISFSSIKSCMTVPAARFTQRKTHNLRIKGEIKY